MTEIRLMSYSHTVWPVIFKLHFKESCLHLVFILSELEMWFLGLMMIINYLAQRALCSVLVWSDELKTMESFS